MIAASAGKSVIAAHYAQLCGSLLVYSRNWGHLSCDCHLRSTDTLPSLRHVSYPAPQSSGTAEGTTFLSAMMDSHTTRSVAPSVSWHADAHKYDRAHMDARQGYPQALLRKQG